MQRQLHPADEDRITRLEARFPHLHAVEHGRRSVREDGEAGAVGGQLQASVLVGDVSTLQDDGAAPRSS
jgi:hypothetical protein